MYDQTNVQKPWGHSSVLVSDYIIYKHGNSFPPFQLIKMVFMAHGLTLAITDKPLIRDRIEAWKYGPVIPVLYHELKIWGDVPVPYLNYCGTIPSQDDEIDQTLNELFERVLTETQRKIIDLIVEQYKDWSFTDLQRLCHEQGSPWDKHYDGQPFTEIPDKTIKAYYKKELEQTGRE